MLTQDYQVLHESGEKFRLRREAKVSDQQSRLGKTCQLIPEFLSQLDPTLGL